mgnify:CR=1 FL=1
MPNVYRTIHYRCSFFISPKGSDFDWAYIIRLIRKWILKSKNAKFSSKDLSRGWFFSGGNLKGDDENRSNIQIAVEEGSGDLHHPEFWAMRFEHQDSSFKFRRWYTDIGITSQGDNYLFSLMVSHQLSPGYFGDEPQFPVPSSPSIIADILLNKNTSSTSSGYCLSPFPTIIERDSEAKSFWKMVIDANRQIPIILLMTLLIY